MLKIKRFSAKLTAIALMASCLALVQCRKPNAAAQDNDANYDPRLSAGAATIFETGTGAFGSSIPGLSGRDEAAHELGDKLFEQPFVAAPAPLYGGLGPVYNNTACGNCHHKDGVGTPTLGLPSSSLLLRISIPGTNEHGGPVAAPGFGEQLQNLALFGTKPEVKIDINYTPQIFTYPDGETTTLYKPTYTLTNPYTALPSNYMLSPRLAPAVMGMGLLELIPEATILSYSDPNDNNHDGIKGHPNYVYNRLTGNKELGRFGLKCNTSSLLLQVATAFQQDMGITSYAQPFESSHGQEQVGDAEHEGQIDLPDTALNAVTFYVRTLGVPARRNTNEATVLRGEALFKQIQCAACHIPTLYTGVDVRLPAISAQRIHPYTDLLLHDMGDDLADNRPDNLATGTEWRTKPLWGIGMLPIVNGIPYYLHDGRARTITEAILWHGGEALNSRQQFARLPKADRNAIIAFLNSL